MAGLIFLLVFAVSFNWLPVSGYVPFPEDPVENLKHLILPAICLGLFEAAFFTRFLRAGLLEVLHQDYVRTAQAKGLAEQTVVSRHALKNALIPMVTVLGLELGTLIGGVVVIEQVFGWSGIGWLALTAVKNRDYPLLQGIVLLVAIGVSLANLLADLSYTFLDPRLRSLDDRVTESTATVTPATMARPHAPGTMGLRDRVRGHEAFFVGLVIFGLLRSSPSWRRFSLPRSDRHPCRRRAQTPVVTYPLGTDNLGRDILSRIIYAARTSLLVALGSVLVAGVVGVPLGLVAG